MLLYSITEVDVVPLLTWQNVYHILGGPGPGFIPIQVIPSHPVSCAYCPIK